MKQKILLLTFTIFTIVNLQAQITWDNAATFTQTATQFNSITANSTTVFAGQTNGDIYTISEGISQILHNSSPIGFSGCVGGIGGSFEAPYYRIRNATDLSIIHQNTSSIAQPASIKGDTLIYNSISGSFLKIGTADPVELTGISGTVKGYVIMNGHIFVYSYNHPNMTEYNFDIQDISNPTISNEEMFMTALTFLDGYKLRKYVTNSVSYIEFYTPNIGWEEITGFDLLGYTNFTISYYGDNEDICLTCLNGSGDLLQIYTAGLPSTENDILTISFTEQTGNATINSTNHTVDIELANGTNLTNLVATFTLSEMATAFIGTTEQTSGTTENDFTSPVTYTIEAENGETQDWTITVTEATVGINTIFENEFSIYPNPTNGKINIETNKQIEKITILDITGKMIIETVNPEIDLSKQQKGTYFMKIETVNGIFTEKIILK